MDSNLVLIVSFVIVTTLVSLSEAHGAALTFELPDNEQTCFLERFKGGERLIFEYRVIRGGNNDVDAWIESPNGKAIYKKEKNEKDAYIFDASRGEFKFCFSNQFSTFTHKIIYFGLRPEDIDNLAVEAGDEQPTVKTAAEMFCENIHESMTSVVNFQKDYRLRETLGRHIAEVMHDRVFLWSIGQACVILVAGFGQVFILKTFFTERRVKREGL